MIPCTKKRLFFLNLQRVLTELILVLSRPLLLELMDLPAQVSLPLVVLSAASLLLLLVVVPLKLERELVLLTGKDGDTMKSETFEVAGATGALNANLIKPTEIPG